MGKITFAASLLLGLFVSQLVYSQCNTGIGRTEGSNNTSSSTVCSNPGNMGAYNGDQGGGGGSGYGSDYRPPEYYTAMDEQARQKAQYCKQNNYPTVVPFCAGIKEQDLLAEKQKQTCIADAETASVNCKNAYGSLLRICSTYVGALGGVAMSKFLNWIRAEEAGLSTALTIGAASVGYSESVFSCDTLAPMAMNYCDVGSKKLRDSCN